MRQLDLIDVPPDGPDALTFFSEAQGEERGEVFTRKEVVEFILDLTDVDKAKKLQISL